MQADTASKGDVAVDLHPQNWYQFNKALVAAAKAGVYLGANFVAELEMQVEGENRREQLEKQGTAPESELDPTYEFNKAFLKAAKTGHVFAPDFAAELETQLEGDKLRAQLVAQGEAASQANSGSELDPGPRFNKALLAAAKAGNFLGANFVAVLETQMEGENRRAQLKSKRQGESTEAELDETLRYNKAFLKAAKAGQLLGEDFVLELEAQYDGEGHKQRLEKQRRSASKRKRDASELAPENSVQFNQAFVKAATAALLGKEDAENRETS